MIYVIQAGEGGPVKIGLAADVRKRIANMQTASAARLNILHVFEGNEAEEKALHRRFAAYRQDGEWFAPAQEILAGDFGLKAAEKPKMTRMPGSARLTSDHPICKMLEDAGMSQARLATMVGITKSAVTDWIAGRSKVSAEIAAAVCSLLGTDPHLLRPDLYAKGSKAPAEWWIPIISERTGVSPSDLRPDLFPAEPA